MSVVLAARGIQDQYLTGNPNTFFFKSVYKQYVDFEVISEQQIVKNRNPAKNTTFYIDVQNKYEYLSKIYCSFTSESQYNAFSQFEYVSLEIGGQTIVSLPFEYIYNANRLKLNDEQAKIYRNSRYGSNVDLDLNEENIPQFVYYLEFPFFFKDYENSLPLYLLQYHNVRLKFKTSATSQVSNFKIYTDYIHINRKFLPREEYSLMIEQVQFATYNISKVVELEFNNPIKEILWLFRKEAFGDYAYNSIFNEMKIQLNGIDTFTRENYFYNLIQPLQYHTNIPKDLFMFSFSLRPESLQPFGTLNGSRLKTFTLIFDQINSRERKLITDYTDFQQGVEILIRTLDYHNTLINFNKDKIPLTFQVLTDIINEYYISRKPDAYDSTTNYTSIETDLRTITKDNNVELVANLNVSNTNSIFDMQILFDNTDPENRVFPETLLRNITRRENTYSTLSNIIQTHNILDGGFMIGKYHSFIIENTNISSQNINRLGRTVLNFSTFITADAHRFLNIVFIPDLVDKIVTLFMAQNELILDGKGSQVYFLGKHNTTEESLTQVTTPVQFESQAIQYFRYLCAVFPLDEDKNIYADIRSLFSNDFDTYFAYVYVNYFTDANSLRNFLTDQVAGLSQDIKSTSYNRYGTYIVPFRQWNVERDNAARLSTFNIANTTYNYPLKKDGKTITRIQVFPVDRYIKTGDLIDLYPKLLNPNVSENDEYYTEFAQNINNNIFTVSQSNLDPSSPNFIPFFYFYMISVITFISYLIKKVAILFYQLPYKEGTPVQDTNIIFSNINDILVYAINYNILDFKEGKAGLRFQT